MLVYIHFIREVGNNEMRVADMDHSNEKYVKTHIYGQFTNDQNTYDFLVDNTSEWSSQPFTYVNEVFCLQRSLRYCYGILSFS